MNHNLQLSLHGLRRLWSRAVSPSSGWLRGSVLSLLLLALALVTPVASWGTITIHGSGPYYTDWFKYNNNENTGITYFVRAYNQDQCKKAEYGNYNPELYMVMSNRQVTPLKPYIEIEIPLIRGKNDCYTTINLLSKTSSGGTETIPTLSCFQRADDKKETYSGSSADLCRWVTKNTNYGVWRHESTKTNQGSNSDMSVAVLRFYPTKEYYAKGICCIEVLQGWDWSGDGGANNMSNYKYTTIDGKFEHTIDNLYTYHLYPTYSDETYQPTVERKAPQQVTYTVKPGKGQSSSRKYVYNISYSGGWKDVEVTSGTTSQDVDGKFDDGFTYKWLAYSLQEMTFSNDYSGNSTPNVTACVFAGGPTVNTGTDTNIGWTYKEVTVGASSDVKSISSMSFNKWAKTVTIEWEKNDGTQNTGHWGIYRTLGSDRKYLGQVNYSTLTYTDTDQNLEYDKTYTYEVSYLPGTDTDYTRDQLYYLNKWKDITLTRSFDFGTMTLEEKEINGKTNIVYTWSHEAITDASSSKTYTLYVQRSKDGGNNWADLGNPINITSSATTGGTYNDADVNVRQPYQYRVKINVQGKDFYSTASQYTITNGSKLTGFSASRGNYNNVVKLSWTVNQVGTNPTYFTLQRRPLGSAGDAGWADIYTTTGTASNYSYDDNTAQPGSFNEYRLRIFDEYNGTKYEGTSLTTDGFSIATGVVSGRITYGTGTAVQGAKVTLSATNADGKSIQSNKAIYLSGEASSGLACNTTNEEIKKILGDGKTFTVQFWMRPQGMKDGNGHILMDIAKTFGLNVKTANSVPWLECMIANNTSYGLDFQLTDDVWQHVSVVYANGKLKAYSTIDGKSFKESTELNQPINETNLNGATALGIGNWQNLGASSRYQGYLDEFRIFSRALTLDEIKQNYNHTLNGSEEGLQVYYPFDEGLASQKVAYDFSKQNGVANGHHATAPIGLVGQGDVVPSEDQLSLMTYTDQNGNYMLRGIPFSGEGTSYTIRPTLGIHEFSPTMENRFFNQNSLTHSGVNFEDVSSFPVSGYVYYENTEYPVEGAQLYVDGNVCAKDGKVLTTDANGRFEISVPIGDHHISVQKQGHTFVNDGRYPADPVGSGTKFTFNQEVKDLTFYDNTTVDVVGRVAGGVIQQDEPIGLLQGKANIGQAKITLEVPTYRFNVEKVYSADSTSYDIQLATKERTFEAVTDNVKSTATVGYTNDDQARIITILTDPVTGEYAVKLPPVAYDVKKVEIVNNKVTGVTYFNSGDLAVLDASNTTEDKDSLVVGDNVHYFNYDLKRNYIYRSPAKITVTDLDNDLGLFGEKTYKVTNVDGTTTDVSLIDGNDYRFDYPIFVQENTYQFDYYGYEEYQFKATDNAEPEIDRVPLQGVELTIQNQFAGTTSVSVGQNGSYADGDIAESEDNVITLDSLGHATYTFTAGFPNIKGDHTLSLSAKYAINGASKDLDPMKAIVFGVLPTGNNFTTAGPDKILYVLRDPPGTHSYAYVEEGTTFESETSQGGTWSSENELTTVSHLGISETFLIGGIGLMKQTTVETKADLTVGLQLKEEGSSKAVKKHTVTTTQRIQTSDEDQFVGANGDVFIGAGTNIIFGLMRKVQPFKASTNEDDWEVDMKETTCMGQKFSTNFFYTTQQIENSILPKYEDLIAEILQPVGTQVSPNPANPVYVSKLAEDDPNFGHSNIDTLAFGKDLAKNTWDKTKHTLEGPSYIVYFPADTEVHSDTITWINSQIKSWKQTLANNEKVKLEAKNSGNLENISFDSGAVIEKSYAQEDYDGTETENTFMLSLVAGFDTGVEINKTGVDIGLKTTTGGGHVYGHTEGSTQAKTTGFVLQDEGEDDKHSIDYGMAGDGYGYVFFTRGGQTSCPYEDAEVTKYYQPGEVLSAATMKIQDPKIRAEKTLISNIPADGTGEVTLLLSNDSEIGEDGYYDLSLVDGTNPDGLQFFMDGQPFASGRSIYLPADNGVTRKTIMVKKGKSSVMHYKDVKLRIASQCQYDPAAAFPEIADTLALTFEFAATCSDIALAVDNKTVNSMTGPTLALTISKYDLNQESLRGIKIQYMKGGNDWALAKEYVTDANDVTDDKELLTTSEATFTLDMSNPVWTDGNYVFRAITVCDADGSVVNNESNEINVVKDMAQPMLIAMPTPTNGILNAGDELSVTFNEDIQYGSLLRTANFYIRGQLNDREVSHDAAFQATGSAGASTDAAIDLADKSFAVNLWLNWNEAGSFVNHGSQDNSFDAAVDAEGHLVVTVAGETYTSDTTIPQNKWNFVSLSMEQTENGAVLNAYAANDANEVALFVGQLTGAYTGNGKFEVGSSVKGAIHEVTLWNEARAWAVAQSEMYTGKSPFTPALIGYWRMDEAHGTTAVDAARSRNMTLPGENAWHMENENHSLLLDGSDYVDLNISEIATNITQDYAVELWMRADKTQADDASVFSMGNNGIDLRIAKSGALELEAKGTTYNISTTDLRDNQWHHIALNVLKSTNGSATVYVDGSQLKQIPASSMPALANDNLLLGARRNINTELVGDPGTFSQYLKGNFDEVRIWHSTMTGDMIRQNMYARVNPADHDGLVAYYPLEKRSLDQYNQIVTSATLADQAQGGKHTAQVLRRTSGNVGVAVADWSSSEAMAMKLAPTTQNVDFSFVGSDRKILITLNETPARIEGCTLYFTVRSVRDMNGNLSDPVTWTAVVNRHQMEWSENAVSIRKANAEAKTFEVDVRNASASTVNWNIAGLPTWLSASAESGTLAAQSSKTVTFTVAASTAVGKYEQTIYVSGDDGVQMPLVVNVVSEGETPEWTVNPAGYEFTMSIFGQLKIDNKLSEDTEDMVAAFNGTECVGVARPQYIKRYDAYFVMMTAYGNDDNDDLSFKVYDASTGITYPSVSVSEAISFEKDGIVGSIENPVVWTPDNKVEQDIALNKGWNWISLYVEPEDKTVGNVLKDVSVAQVKTSGLYTQYAAGTWAGELKEMGMGTMYKMQASADGELQVIGTPVVSAETPISIYKGWNWLGVATTATLSPAEAFAGLDPQEGDLVKSQREFSMYSENDWVGSLDAIVPGVGYLYSSEGTSVKSFTYPAKSSTQGRKNAARRASATVADGSAIELLENNMNVILTVIDENGEQRDDAIIRVSAFGQLRGEALAPNYGSEYFLTVQGKADDAEMQLSVELDGVTYNVGTIVFEKDALYGSVKQPVVIVIGEATAISSINAASHNGNGSVYDLGGRRVSSDKLSNGQLHKGIYIYDHQKVVK